MCRISFTVCACVFYGYSILNSLVYQVSVLFLIMQMPIEEIPRHLLVLVVMAELLPQQ